MRIAASDHKRTLITGAGGFLGSWIASYLGVRGHQIAVAGRLSTFPDAGKHSECWKIFGMTLPDRRFQDAVQLFNPNLVVHCAGTASVSDSVHAPYIDFQRTAEVCAFVLETLRTLTPGCRFILLSSAAVYGNPKSIPVAEEAPLCPISPYGYHKVLCELLTEEYSVLHGIPSAILRIFSAYGEGLRRQVVYDLFNKFTDPDSSCVEILGTGEETRDFIHAEDLAQIVSLIADSGCTGVFNAASGNETTISSLSNLVSKTLCSDKQVIFNGNRRAGDPVNWRADISRLKSIGFSPRIDLADGIASFKEWFLKQGGNA